MVAVTAQIVHFLPKLVPVRADLNKELAQSKHLRLQYREFQGQFVSRVFFIALSRFSGTLLKRVRIGAGVDPERADLCRRLYIIAHISHWESGLNPGYS